MGPGKYDARKGGTQESMVPRKNGPGKDGPRKGWAQERIERKNEDLFCGFLAYIANSGQRNGGPRRGEADSIVSGSRNSLF